MIPALDRSCVERVHNVDDTDVALDGRDEQAGEEERRHKETA